ncbi:MAG: AbrB family transcriptional regulator [Cyanobacteriota bacterium]|nr:AbrB family transcriptional regulator [Cyanobacteriota bacterium]
MAETATTPLTGKPLLQKVKELSHKNRRDTAKECGYYTVTKNGEERVNLTGFYDAILAAKGIPLDPSSGKDGRGREPTYRVSVHKNGQIVIGSTYTESMGLKAGDEFEIKLGYKHIHLIQIEGTKSSESNGSTGTDEELEDEMDEEDGEEEEDI